MRKACLMTLEALSGRRPTYTGARRARFGVWPGRRHVPGIVVRSGWGTRGAECHAPRRPPAAYLLRRCAMDTLFSKGAGFDVHLKRIQCAVRCRQESGKLLTEVRSFGTMTRDLRALADYLQALGVTHVALEATGVYWKPVWNIFEGRFTLLLVNPRHLKKGPGRETDVSDAEWIARLLQHGLLRGSFVPPRPLRELRDLTRHRAPLTSEHTRVSQ